MNLFDRERTIDIVAVCLLLIATQVVIVAEYFSIPNRKENPFSNSQACSQEAMICPDSSAVGRTGPNCEFAECAKPSIAQDEGSPSTSSGQLDTSSWKTYRNEEYGFEVRYLSSLSIIERGVPGGVTFVNYTWPPDGGDALFSANLELYIGDTKQSPEEAAFGLPITTLSLGDNIYKRINRDGNITNYFLNRLDDEGFIFFFHKAVVTSAKVRNHEGFLDIAQQEQLVQSILSTLKFIK